MYIVIFKATLKSLDDNYYQTADRMRQLALKDYGCVQLDSICDGGREITLSYWHSEEDILAWKNNPEHRHAQKLGVSQWYESYQVEVVKLGRQYGS